MSKLDMTEQVKDHDKWTHETGLINNRISWLMASQTLLFAAYGVVAVADIKKTNPDVISSFIKYIPLMGLALSSVILIGVLAAILSMAMLKKKNPKIDVNIIATSMGGLTSIFIPIIFAATWYLLICSNLQ